MWYSGAFIANLAVGNGQGEKKRYYVAFVSNATSDFPPSARCRFDIDPVYMHCMVSVLLALIGQHCILLSDCVIRNTILKLGSATWICTFSYPPPLRTNTHKLLHGCICMYLFLWFFMFTCSRYSHFLTNFITFLLPYFSSRPSEPLAALPLTFTPSSICL